MNTIKLKQTIESKTGICVALDLNKKDKILEMIELMAPNIGIFKLHCDIIDDFDDIFIKNLIKLKQKYKFFIWEDRKFSDIGYICEQQLHKGLHKISTWADIVSFHSTCGYKSIPVVNNLYIFLVVELSVSNHLCDINYINKSIEIANTHPNIIGVVCQHKPIKLNKNILIVVPGISLTKTEDSYNQQYKSIEHKQFGDIYVIGRSITQNENPIEIIDKYKQSI